MKTTSVMLQTLCIPCHCHCRYCLLSWDGRTIGADYERSERYAKRFYDWIREKRPDLSFTFSFGYSMEHPMLFRAIDFMRSIGSPGGEFLQFDGMRLRNREELQRLTADLAKHGIKQLNFTFYGEREYHDRFAGRRGDFDLMLDTARAASEVGLQISAGIPLTKENACAVDTLTEFLRGEGFERTALFIPHGEGRGAALDPIRFSASDYVRLGDDTKKLLNTKLYRTEREWLESGDFLPTENRALIISLTPENIADFERDGFETVLSYVERLDEAYYSTVPTFEELSKRYGNAENAAFYRRRDLYLHYQKRFLADEGIHLYDVNDERQCGSRRY